MNKKSHSIKTTILKPIMLALIAGIAAMVLVVGLISFNTASNLSARLASARVSQYANDFTSLSVDSYSTTSTLVPIVTNLPRTSENPRVEAESAMGSALLTSKDMLAVWALWEDDAFDGKDAEYAGQTGEMTNGRFGRYISRNGSTYAVAPLPGTDDPGYHKAVDTGKPVVTEPYFYDVGGKEVLMYSLVIPVIENGKAVGAIGADINMESINPIFDNASILDDGYLFLLSTNGAVAAHPNRSLQNTNMSSTWLNSYSSEINDVLQNGGVFEVVAHSDQTGEQMLLNVQGVSIGDAANKWAVCGVVPQRTVNKDSTLMLIILIAVGGALIAFISIIIVRVLNTSLKDLPQLTLAANEIALGDVDIDLKIDSDNEIGELAEAFDKMIDGIQKQAKVMDEISAGDYSGKVDIRSDKDVMGQAISNMLDNVNQTLGEILTSTEQVTAGTQQVAQGAQTLATGSTEQAASIQEISASISEVHSQAKATMQEAQTATNDVTQASEFMNLSMDSMNKMTKAMQDISESSNEISKVIKVIEDIAFQTNILALNAAVEAARAGEAGKGFAVVADEVRNLASKSSEAAQETSSMIANSIEKVAEGNEIVDQTNQNMKAVDEISGKNAAAMSKINQMSQNQSNAIQEITQGMEQISTVVQSNSATSQESAAAAQQMSGQAELMNRIVSRFKLRK